MNTGFTLIELLVVVIIIGILAAIAFPQYQKAVERSRIAEAVQVLGDWANAQSVYYMQHNAFANDINNGDITFSTPGDAFSYDVDSDWEGIALIATRTSGMYEGGKLAATVTADGSVQKICDGPDGFCPTDYEPGDLGNGGGDEPPACASCACNPALCER